MTRVISIILFFVFQGTVLADIISNPSFEDGYPQWDPPGWSSNHTGNSAWTGDHLGKRIESDDDWPYWSTDGNCFLYMWTGHNLMTTSGDYINVYQSVDLTGIPEIRFDTNLVSPSGWNNTIQSQFVVNDIILWSADLEGTYLNQSVNVSDFTGINIIELRLMLINSGTYNSQWVMWDNLRAIPEPATLLLLGLGAVWLRSRRAVMWFDPAYHRLRKKFKSHLNPC